MAQRTRRAWRNTLTARLLLGGLLITVVLVASVSGFLLVSRALQTSQAVQSEAANRAATGYQLLQHVTEPQTQYAATTVARSAALAKALATSDPATRAVAVQTLLGSALTDVSSPGSRTVVLDTAGTVDYTDECGTTTTVSQCESSGGPHVTPTTPSAALALAEGARAACAGGTTSANRAECPAGYEGVEILGGSLPAFDAAVVVRDRLHRFLGVIDQSSTLQTQFQRYGSAMLYTPVVVSTAATPTVFRYDPAHDDTMTSAPVIGAWAGVLANRPESFTASYIAGAAGGVDVSYLAVHAPDGSIPGYLGVEVPTSVFAGETGADERTIILIGITAIVLVFMLIAAFSSRFVVRPIAQLERGVRRIAGGDLSSDIVVTSDDELGRLARSVNIMRAQIAGYIAHLDGSLQRLESVSHALTTTTEGVDALKRSVLSAAQAIGGGEALAAIFTADDGSLQAASGAARSALSALRADEVANIMIGEHVRRAGGDGRPGLLAVPMTYHGAVQGALAVWSFREMSESDEKALAALANNASVALENTRLFEQERETVQRLRELDVLKTDFLSNTQHELRTPVLAIRGELELITLAWQQLDDAAKLDLVRDMEISARLLGDIVENIVVFSMLSSEAISLHPGNVDAGAAINEAVAQVRENHKDGLPVELTLSLQPHVTVRADRDRFLQVVRALLDNAVKFSAPNGHVTVTTAIADGACRITVEDDGIGIDESELGTVFDHLRQVDGSRTRRYGGMGMGLALVRRLCEAHGGSVAVRSRPGEGSCFTVTWPLVVKSAKPAVAGVG